MRRLHLHAGILFLSLLGAAVSAGRAEPVFRDTWATVPDRVWAGEDYWANPMEDWQVRDGGLECLNGTPGRSVHLLTAALSDRAEHFSLSVDLAQIESGRGNGSAGFLVGVRDEIDDYRAAALRGRGLACGVTGDGRLFIGRPPAGTVSDFTPVGLPRSAWKLHHADSTQGDDERPEMAWDGDPATFWHTRYGTPPYPHEIQIDLGRDTEIRGFAYLPRQDSAIGRIQTYAFYISRDGKDWGAPVEEGSFPNIGELQQRTFNPVTARYVRLLAKSDHAGRPAAVIAELMVLGTGETKPVRQPVPNPATGLPDRARLQLKAEPEAGGAYTLTLTLTDAASGSAIDRLERKGVTPESLAGGLALFHNDTAAAGKMAGSRFAFKNWTVTGPKLELHPERAFGPVLWAMHTLSHSRGPEGCVMTMTAQMPPLGAGDTQTVELQVREGQAWSARGSAAIEPDARTATFRVPLWPADRDIPYRLVYRAKHRDDTREHTYPGTVRREPAGRPVVIAGFTGNTDYVFPNREIARNVALQDPDVLFFSGDQIYEHVGGFGIIRTPADRSILNYLRKWYLLGWAFGDLMRDRVTLCLPDDHDVYQGNIWGQGGRDCGGIAGHASGGYAQPVEMVNAVHVTQTSHHPDPFDPTPIDRGISVYYGDMVYGRVSFAILADRMFKSGPQDKVETGSGRPDWVKDPSVDIASLDKPGLKLLGDRQLAFLDAWTRDWRQADMKIALSQTIFCNVANYHGPAQEYLVADLDSNGWPQSGRNRALAALRRGCAFHLAGDQHLASIVWHGIDNFRDAGWSFCVPSIAAGYPRSWRPDAEGRPVRNRPEPGLENTGDYFDGLGNRVTVYAVGNPEKENRRGAVNTAHDKASGYGLVRMDPAERTIAIECWRLQFDAAHPNPGDQFPGWPRTIGQFDNDGREAAAWLPTLNTTGLTDPVVEVVREETGEVLYTVRTKGNTFSPKVFAPGLYTVHVGDPDKGKAKKIEHLRAAPAGSAGAMAVAFESDAP